MKIIQPSFKIEGPPQSTLEGHEMLQRVEEAGRTCYKSEGKSVPGSYMKFVHSLIERGHESVLEHEKVTVRIICDRGISHQLVRHRLASFSQESTRYCNYSQDRFDNELTFIDLSEAFGWDPITDRCYAIWEDSMRQAEQNYLELIEYGAKPQEARSVLPNSLKTDLVITANLREWRVIFKQRTEKGVHPQMKQIMTPMLGLFSTRIPIVFDDITRALTSSET